MFEDSRTKVFVCNVTNAAGAASIPLLPAQSGSFYVDPQTQKEDVIAAVPTRFVYRNTRSVLSMTPYFIIGDVYNAGGYAYLARQEQVTYLGYNGTAGSMDAANSTYYGLQIVLNHTFGMLNNSPLIVTVPYKSDASATQREVAAGLAIAGTAAFRRQAYKPLMIERINSGAMANDLSEGTTLAVINGSKVITFAVDPTPNVVVGTIIRIGALGAGTTPCYVVTAVDGATITLDQEYQGATNATVAENVVESVTEGNWGLKFTGISVTDANFNPVTDEPFVVSFELGTRDFDTATATYTTESRIGSGTYQLVSAMEARSQFENKTREVSAYPPTVRNIDAIAATTYDCVAFELYDQKFVDTTTGIRPVSRTRYVIFYEHSIHAAELFDVVMGVDF